MGNCFTSEHKDVAVNTTFEESPLELKVPSLDSLELNKQENEDVYKNCTDENTPYYTYEGIKKKVKVLRVIDGDTVDIAYHHEETNKIFKYRVRLYGIDTPEKRPPKSDPNRDKEIAASKRSSAALTEYLQKNENIVLALFYKPDKYGRLLRYVFLQNDPTTNEALFINKYLVQEGYAHAATFPPDVLYSDLFARLQEEAMKEKKGLWKVCLTK